MDESSAARFRDAVCDASRRNDVRVAVDAVYQHLQDAIDIRRPVCKTSGRCCRFDEFGHRLFVTTLEMASFVAANPLPRRAGNGGCPFQVGGLCSVHATRPFGCRVFFCDETAEVWQREQYERLHAVLKRLHDDLKVPYFYVEWREALRLIPNLIPVAADSSALTSSGQTG